MMKLEQTYLTAVNVTLAPSSGQTFKLFQTAKFNNTLNIVLEYLNSFIF